jgi:hypothetical protein
MTPSLPLPNKTTVILPPSVVSEAMLDDYGYEDAAQEWGYIPSPQWLRKGGAAFEVDAEQHLNLFDLVIERCYATYTCNDDRDQGPIAAWTYLKKHYRDEILDHEERYSLPVVVDVKAPQ